MKKQVEKADPGASSRDTRTFVQEAQAVVTCLQAGRKQSPDVVQALSRLLRLDINVCVDRLYHIEVKQYKGELIDAMDHTNASCAIGQQAVCRLVAMFTTAGLR